MKNTNNDNIRSSSLVSFDYHQKLNTNIVKKIKKRDFDIFNCDNSGRLIGYDFQDASKNIKEEDNQDESGNCKEDRRIKYWETLSPWDPNYHYGLHQNNYLFTVDYKKYKNDSIDKLSVQLDPIHEFLHNRIVELIPLGIHNIWFYAIEDSETHKFCYLDFARGVQLFEDEFDEDVHYNFSKLMNYVNNLLFLGLDVIEINEVWCDKMETYCKCFQFRGFKTVGYIPGLARVSVAKEDIFEFYPAYSERKFVYTYPFSQEQIELREAFDKHVYIYFYSRKYKCRLFNHLQEQPIIQYIKEFIEYEEVKYAHEMHYRFQSKSRTYRLSFHMESACWYDTSPQFSRQSKELNEYDHRIWSMSNNSSNELVVPVSENQFQIENITVNSELNEVSLLKIQYTISGDLLNDEENKNKYIIETVINTSNEMHRVYEANRIVNKKVIISLQDAIPDESIIITQKNINDID